ncbi:MAG: hypothetical protein E7E41_23020, partial [Klebsiella oxytoca]|nr:hypothetical protein [Klebsiella oxytoca]MDU3331822.1 hypothetical protein [Klebsiella oxytoca]MDU3468476.1 hypothetical protein [Klebsiella oxytoca]
TSERTCCAIVLPSIIFAAIRERIPSVSLRKGDGDILSEASLAVSLRLRFYLALVRRPLQSLHNPAASGAKKRMESKAKLPCINIRLNKLYTPFAAKPGRLRRQPQFRGKIH